MTFFFFQAEDGIRDGHVTGVQTCALPICSTPQTGESVTLYDGATSLGSATLNASGIATFSFGPNTVPTLRSEERRVGKECRSLRSQDPEKKKKTIATENDITKHKRINTLW